MWYWYTYSGLLWESFLRRHTGVSPQPQLSGQHSLWEAPVGLSFCHFMSPAKRWKVGKTWPVIMVSDWTCQISVARKTNPWTSLTQRVLKIIEQGLACTKITWGGGGAWNSVWIVREGGGGSVIYSCNKHPRWFWCRWSSEHTEECDLGAQEQVGV